MNHTITNRLAALLLLAIGVMGCSKEETLPDTPDTARIPITISVTDGGYAPSDKSAAQSRAVENGYATEFTLDDKIGLYVVKPDGSSCIHENICLTLTATGEWTPPADTKLYYDATAKYFAYYPYQSTLTGDVVPSAADAAGFFANVVSGWTPTVDQSSYALYTASDLMVGSGTPSKQADGAHLLALTMTHAMALVVIETPATKYAFDNSPKIPDYYIPVSGIQFYDFTPYSPTGGTYRYLVKPGQSGATSLIGSYTATNGTTPEYIIEQNGMAAANYAHYRVDGGIIEKTHTLKAGDFYLKDGSLLSESVTPTEEQQAACIGIVYWVGDATAKDKTLKQNHPGCTHGLVVALNDNVTALDWQRSSASVQEWLDLIKPNQFLPVLTGTKASDPLNNIQGYNNTKAIEAFNASALRDYDVAAVQGVVDYRGVVLAPKTSSDWYLPSAKELALLCGTDVDSIYLTELGVANRDLINSKLKSINGATELQLEFTESYYWSSSESKNDEAFFIHFQAREVNLAGKNGYYRIRPSLAF